MPVGCLGNSTHMSGSTTEMDVIVTSSVLNTADQFAFMQQTLLMQIFRVNLPSSPSPPKLTPPLQNTSSAASTSSTSSSMQEIATNGHHPRLSCPTCIAFSDQCCQQDSGINLFHEFQEANLQCCVWDQRLSEAISSLRYQGYVCPGILVMIANSVHLEVIADLWKRQLLTSPPGCRISQVGLSTGCVVKPVPLSHSISLPDVLCLILARLKQRGQVADMNTICDSVGRDWAGLVSRMRNGGGSPHGHNGGDDVDTIKENVHAALGALIKQRKVYYTGNKGYFLVGPPDSSNTNGSNGFFGTNGNSPVAKTIGSKFSQLRHSLRERSSSTSSSKNGSKISPGPAVMVDQECQAGGFANNQDSPQSPQYNNNNDSSRSSKEASPNSSSSFNLERSQSLRISKKSLKNLSKGGSLRLSKREANHIKSQETQAVEDEASVISEGSSSSPPKPFERKNSFLSKLFSSGSSRKKNSADNKPELATFTAQFPPPELVEANNAIYQQLVLPASPQTNIMRSIEGSNNGPNPAASPQVRSQLRQHPPPMYGYTASSNSSSNYGYSVMRHQHSSSESVYSNPPPPLPYRPPPPNPYTSAHASSSASPVLRPSATYTPSPNSMRAHRTTPPSPHHSSMPTYAKVSNLRNKAISPTNGNGTRNVRFADESPGHSLAASSTSSSGPSSMESQTTASTTRPLFDDTLVVIEKSNQELELKLNNNSPTKQQMPNTSVRTTILRQQQLMNKHHRAVDTIHNNRNSLVQEVIYEVEAMSTPPVNYRQAGNQNVSNEMLSRSSSQSTLKPDSSEHASSVAPSYPSLSDLTINDIGGCANFKSLTAQKLMAGLSFNSIDTLLEVNAAAEARNKLNESTETVDFGVI